MTVCASAAASGFTDRSRRVVRFFRPCGARRPSVEHENSRVREVRRGFEVRCGIAIVSFGLPMFVRWIGHVRRHQLRSDIIFRVPMAYGQRCRRRVSKWLSGGRLGELLRKMGHPLQFSPCTVERAMVSRMVAFHCELLSRDVVDRRLAMRVVLGYRSAWGCQISLKTFRSRDSRKVFSCCLASCTSVTVQ